MNTEEFEKFRDYCSFGLADMDVLDFFQGGEWYRISRTGKGYDRLIACRTDGAVDLGRVRLAQVLDDAKDCGIVRYGDECSLCVCIEEASR